MSSVASGEFIVADVRPDSLLVRFDSISLPRPIEARSVYRLEVYRGKTSRVWGFLGGAVGGGLLGGLWGVPCTSTHLVCETISQRNRAVIGVGAGALAGLLLWGGRDRWQEARLVDRSALAANGLDAAQVVGGLPLTEAGPARKASSSDFISEEELREQSDQREDAYALVQRLHPNWLRARISAGLSGSRIEPVVFQNDVRYGEVGRLRDFSIGELRSIEYISAQNATTRFGTGYGGGVIMVRKVG